MPRVWSKHHFGVIITKNFLILHRIFWFLHLLTGDERAAVSKYQIKNNVSIEEEHEPRAGLGVQPPGGLRGAKAPPTFTSLLVVAHTYRKRSALSFPLPPSPLVFHGKSVSPPSSQCKNKKILCKIKKFFVIVWPKALFWVSNWKTRSYDEQEIRNTEKSCLFRLF